MKSNRNERGFSMVELLIASSVALIGLFASLNMAMFALHANQERRDSIAAEQYAEHVLSTIQAEGLFWTDLNPPQIGWYLFRLPSLTTAGVLPSPSSTGWQLVPGTDQSDDKRVGRMGNDWIYDRGVRSEIQAERGVQYCGFWRLTWVTDSLARAEVKVAWQRTGLNVDKYKDCPVTMTDDVGNVGTMTLPAMVMKNVYVQ
jgi:prepilin-type N-terminal cleavage/methylation domain-containing protein